MQAFTIDDRGDKKKRLGDHALIVVGLKPDGTIDPLNNQPQPNAATTPITATQVSKTVAAAGTAERLVGTSTLVESLELHARKSRAAANAGNVYIGFVGTANLQLRVLAPGETFPMTAPSGKKIDLREIWIDAATNGDGVVISAFN